MNAIAERRSNPRLRLCYPIRVAGGTEERAPALGRTVTRNLSSRGAYFSTFDGDGYRVGSTVHVVVSVPHRLAGGAREVLLDLRGTAKVIRVDEPAAHGLYGEDGLRLVGVAIEFSNPLSFHYAWV